MPPRTASIGIFFFPLPFIIFSIFSFLCLSSLLPAVLLSSILSLVLTVVGPIYFVGGADTRCSLLFRPWCRHSPSLRPYKPPPPCVHQVARTKIEEKIGEEHSNKPTISYLPMEFPSPPSRKDRVSVPEGVHVKMCLCGTPCRLMRSTDPGYTDGRRYWMCANYEYDPSQHRSSSNRRRVIHTFLLLYKILF